MSAIVASIAVTLCFGIFAGTKLVRARAQYRNSKYRSLLCAAPVVAGAVLVYVLVRANPFAAYLPALYLLGVGVGFLPSTLESSASLKSGK